MYVRNSANGAPFETDPYRTLFLFFQGNWLKGIFPLRAIVVYLPSVISLRDRVHQLDIVIVSDGRTNL
jgi:hypothetical protein